MSGWHSRFGWVPAALFVSGLLTPGRIFGAAALYEWHTGEGYQWAPLAVPQTGKTGFTTLTPDQTGITFTNWLPDECYLTNQILLNGSGVAAGDVDGDGRCDLFFCGINRPCSLWRNLGNWKFVDITAEAGVDCAGQHSSGAVFADVDGNGTLDLLVNGIGTGTRLFLNDGKGHFREATTEWRLRGGTGSMSMALADIDGDGFLDLYVANYRATTFRDEPEMRFKAAVADGHYNLLAVNGRPVTSPDLIGRFAISSRLGVLENGEAHVLYHNTGHGFSPLNWTNGTFLDEDAKPAAVPYDWGLSVMFRDLNGDGAPDIYVCNDFHSPDRIWINDGQGRFHAIPRLALRQTSLFSMGIDFADIDRDGRDDFFVADMLSRAHVRRQVQLMDRPPVELSPGEMEDRPQYSRNMLFWNRGDNTYAEIAQLSGIEASEWTWCPVFLDVDLDGFEDLLLVTGHLRDAQNIDISRRIEAIRKQKPLSHLEQLKLRQMFTKLDIPNLAFRNRGDLTFEETGSVWGFDSHRVSQGIALADLDNDGDLDVVINCLNDGPLLLRNDSNRPRVAVRLRGNPPNTAGIGAKIIVTQQRFPTQSQEVICGGRYLSCDDPMRVFAAASADTELTITVRWRSGRRSEIAHAKPNCIYEITESRAEANSPTVDRARVARRNEAGQSAAPLFKDVSALLGHAHHDEPYDDFQRQPLLPYKLSQLGPGITWFDWDGDGWEDLVIPSGRGTQLAVYRNDGKGGFARVSDRLFSEPVPRDQTTAVGWAGPGSGRELIVGSANYEDGQGNGPVAVRYPCGSEAADTTLPGQMASTGPLALADVDGSGALDLFVGGRVTAGRFPEPASSLFFRSKGGTMALDPDACRALAGVGMVSGAVWSDLDGDGFPELILACQGGPVRVFKVRGGAFQDITKALGLERYRGLWNSVNVGDFDGDGRMDIVVGNWGRNTPYQSYLQQPIHFYHGDLAENGSTEIVEAYHDRDLNAIVPFRDWETLSAAMPFIRERYHSFTEFSTASVTDFLGDRMSRAKDMLLTTLDSMLFLNRGDHFEARSLPLEAQLAPVFGIAVGDVTGDGNEDIFLAQNFFEVRAQISRLDAGRGLLLEGNGRGEFRAVPGQESGLMVYGEGRGAAFCDYDHDGRLDLVVAQNANATELYRNEAGQPGLRVLLQGPPGNPQGIGAALQAQYRGGRLGPLREIHAGSGYWSQDSATLVFGLAQDIEAILVKWPGGALTKTAVKAGIREIRIAREGPE